MITIRYSCWQVISVCSSLLQRSIPTPIQIVIMKKIFRIAIVLRIYIAHICLSDSVIRDPYIAQLCYVIAHLNRSRVKKLKVQTLHMTSKLLPLYLENSVIKGEMLL